LGKSRYEGSGYNTNQSEIAIGSGGWLEKDSSKAHKPKEDLFQNSIPIYYSRRRMGFCWFLSCNGAICRIVAQNNLLSRTTKKQTVGFMVTVLQEFYLLLCKYCHGFRHLPLEFHFRFLFSEDLDFGVLHYYFIKMDANKVNEW
jgi:rod shape determining protein RodA